LNRDAVHTALDEVESQGLHHYNVRCPHCGRTNLVPRKDLERAAPDWKKPEQQKDSV
jgi:transposase-like protein